MNYQSSYYETYKLNTCFRTPENNQYYFKYVACNEEYYTVEKYTTTDCSGSAAVTEQYSLKDYSFTYSQKLPKHISYQVKYRHFLHFLYLLHK